MDNCSENCNYQIITIVQSKLFYLSLQSFCLVFQVHQFLCVTRLTQSDQAVTIRHYYQMFILKYSGLFFFEALWPAVHLIICPQEIGNMNFFAVIWDIQLKKNCKTSSNRWYPVYSLYTFINQTLSLKLKSHFTAISFKKAVVLHLFYKDYWFFIGF